MKKYAVFFAVFFCPLLIFSQKMSVEGSLDFINEMETMQVLFNYDEVAVGKFQHEIDYVRREYTEKEDKEPGSGEKWRREWYNNRQERFEPKFIALFNEYASDYNKAITSSEETKYLMLVKTRFVEPGWNVGVSRVPAMINLEVEFFDRSNPDNMIAKIRMNKCPGRDAMGFDFDAAYRMEEAYAKAGKSLAKFIHDRVVKANKKKKSS